MKICITGVAGFLGSHLADRMIELGYEVVGIDNLVGGFIENINPKVEFHEEDCNNFESMKNLMKDCDVVFMVLVLLMMDFLYLHPIILLIILFK